MSKACVEQFRVSLILRRLQEPSAEWSRLWQWLLAPPHAHVETLVRRSSLKGGVGPARRPGEDEHTEVDNRSQD